MTREKRIRFLIQELNEDLARKLGSIIRYNYQAAKAAGRDAQELCRLLRAEATEELEHAAVLADVIVELGGEPTTTPAEFDKPRCHKLMLELDVLMEQCEERRYLQHARIAGELGELGLKGRLEAIAAAHSANIRELSLALQALEPNSQALAH